MCAEYERQIEAEQREVRESMALSPPMTRPSTTCTESTPASRPAQSKPSPRQAPETPQKESGGDGGLSPSSPSATLQVCNSLLCQNLEMNLQGPRIKTNGSLPRDGKRLPSPSRSIGNSSTISPNSPLSPQSSAEPDSGKNKDQLVTLSNSM